MAMHIDYAERLINKLKAENAELRARLDKVEKLEAFGTYIKQHEDAEEAIASFYGLGTDAQIVWNKYGTNSPQENAPRARHDNNTAEVAERALVIMAEKVLEYAEKAKVTAMTSDGLFSCGKDAQLALLVNDALLKAKKVLAEEQR